MGSGEWRRSTLQDSTGGITAVWRDEMHMCVCARAHIYMSIKRAKQPQVFEALSDDDELPDAVEEGPALTQEQEEDITHVLNDCDWTVSDAGELSSKYVFVSCGFVMVHNIRCSNIRCSNNSIGGMVYLSRAYFSGVTGGVCFTSSYALF